MKINAQRLHDNIERYAQIGKMDDVGVERIALSEEDKQARDLLKRQMFEAGLKVHIDQLGNMIGLREGKTDGPAVAFGSHLDTVYAGGRFDGALGVIAGLELIHTLNEFQIETDRPLALVNFTNEEGVRFAPDMMGSHVYAGLADVEEILASKAYDEPNETVGSRLEAIGYAGALKPGTIPFHSFLELHIEQGPILEAEQVDIGAVEMVQGIYWTKYTFKGQANHAGTTPISYRKDAGYGLSQVTHFIGDLARKEDSNILTTIGSIQISPNAVNIVPAEATFTLDLRSVDFDALKDAQESIDTYIKEVSEQFALSIDREEMVRFAPVQFDDGLVNTVAEKAKSLGLSVRKMPSGAGHDAQMMASICPSAMIFVPSVDGISHNVKEYSHEHDIFNGANVLLATVQSSASLIK